MQIILFENAIIGHFATRAVSGSFGLVVGKSTRPSIFSLAHPPQSAPPPNHLVPVFSCEKALNIKKIIKIEGLGLGWCQVTVSVQLLVEDLIQRYSAI
jgi:hypothetical protein